MRRGRRGRSDDGGSDKGGASESDGDEPEDSGERDSDDSPRADSDAPERVENGRSDENSGPDEQAEPGNHYADEQAEPARDAGGPADRSAAPAAETAADSGGATDQPGDWPDAESGRTATEQVARSVTDDGPEASAALAKNLSGDIPAQPGREAGTIIVGGHQLDLEPPSAPDPCPGSSPTRQHGSTAPILRR